MVAHPLWRPFATGANAARQTHRVAFRQVEPGALSLHQARWTGDFEVVRRRIQEALGDQVLAIAHVGSTAVPDLVAKPIVDIDVTLWDVADEPAYLPRLEGAGFRLIFRDSVGVDAHRQLTLAQPNVNVHLWNPDAVEPRRHVAFAAWLIGHEEDRRLYSATKSAAAASDTGRYNDGKAAVVYDIYERIFAEDPLHPHDPHPRPPGGATG
jgi:GrpB-like predicted nucleotidyltransferase (UPF0157 family)